MISAGLLFNTGSIFMLQCPKVIGSVKILAQSYQELVCAGSGAFGTYMNILCPSECLLDIKIAHPH